MSPILDLILHCYVSLVEIFSLYANLTEFLAFFLFFFSFFEYLIFPFSSLPIEKILYFNRVELQLGLKLQIMGNSLFTGVDEPGKE